MKRRTMDETINKPSLTGPERVIATIQNATIQTRALAAATDSVAFYAHTGAAQAIPRLDKATTTLQTIEYEHHEIHGGSSFITSYAVDLGNGATADLLITTPNTTKWAHVVFTIEHELEAHVYLYENPTVSDAGTGITTYNRDRNSATAATTTVKHTPTVDPVGTLIWEDHSGSGRTTGGGSHSNGEFVLKQNEDYLLRITNAIANAANYIAVHIDWYEHTNHA